MSVTSLNGQPSGCLTRSLRTGLFRIYGQFASWCCTIAFVQRVPKTTIFARSLVAPSWARFLGEHWVVSGRRERRALRALGRQYVSVRPHLTVAPGHSGL